MAKVANSDQAALESESNAYPYPPSWVDRFTDWVEELPVPYWLFYLALGLVLAFVETVVQWHGGSYPISTLDPFHAWFAGQIAFLLALMHYLDKAADAALTTFRPALNVSEAKYVELRYRLTTLPARSTLGATLAGATVAIIVLLMTFHILIPMAGFASSRASIILNKALLLIVLTIASTLVYHTIHQLRLVSRIYATYAIVDLFNLGPLYAFSGLTVRTALGVIIYNYAWYATEPELLSQPHQLIGLGFGIFYAVVAIVTFAWPLLGIHRRLVEEKERLLSEASQRLKATIAELHRRVDAGELRNMDDMNKAMASLEIELNQLTRIPTWPWQPETLRGLITTLLLPVVVFLIQLVLQRTFGR
jgi:hypothetical protein